MRLEDAISITPYILSASEGCAGTLQTSPTRRLEDATLVTVVHFAMKTWFQGSVFQTQYL